jgi:hypothetical protein
MKFVGWLRFSKRDLFHSVDAVPIYDVRNADAFAILVLWN